jgi:glucose-1-phosphate thymidylyltransferase
MKVVIPLAGKGTRLRPHTHVVPKPMLRVAGQPVMSYILDDLRKLGDVEEIIYITGHLKEKVEAYAKQALDVRTVFVEQQVQNGTAGAVALARPYVDQPVLIIFVDTIFDADLSIIDRTDADGIIWTKEVEDYQSFGVVVTDADGFMTRIVEKPSTPISKRANIGLQFIRDWRLLFEGIDHVLAAAPNKGEYYLTDALQYMVDKGARIKVVDVRGWFDAGKLDTLLETNRAMLDRGRARRPRTAPGSTIVDPVYIEDGVALKASRVGPNVSIGAGSVIEACELRDTIVGSEAQLRHCHLHSSLIGDHVLLEGVRGEVTVGDHSEVRSVPATARTAAKRSAGAKKRPASKGKNGKRPSKRRR